MAKRLRAPKAKDGELKMCWGRLPQEDPDMIVAWGSGCDKRDGSLLHYAIASKKPNAHAEHPFRDMLPSLLDDLKARGYDLSTFKLSIRKLQKEPTT